MTVSGKRGKRELLTVSGERGKGKIWIMSVREECNMKNLVFENR